MSFLVDTDTCSAQLKGNREVGNRFLQYTGGLFISTVTLGELYTWAFRKKAPPARVEALRRLLTDVTVLPMDSAVAERFGSLRAALFDAGVPAPDMDLPIAATAITHDLTLVTHNTADFAHVPGLRLMDWLSP